MCSPFWVLLLFWSFQCLAGASNPFLVSVTYSESSNGIDAEALKSAVEWVDAAVLIDTGTDDAPHGIAELVAGRKLHVKQLPRPASPEDAQSTALRIASDLGGSWGVLLQPDERLQGMPGLIRDFLNSTQADVVTVTFHGQAQAKFYRLPVDGEHTGQNPTYAVLQLDTTLPAADEIGVGIAQDPADVDAAQDQTLAGEQHSNGAECALPAANSTKPSIGLGFTTAKRPAHFIRTYLSFRLRCLDCSKMIDDWYAVDDGSSAEELAEMKAIAPNVKWLEKPVGQAGHVGSINALMKVAAGYDYFVWMEDDWLFVRDAHLVSKALEVFRAEPNVAQVLFNTDYRETDHAAEASLLSGGDLHELCGQKYVMHKYCGSVGSDTWKACMQPGRLSHYHWPHFSLRPGVWRMSQISSVGPIEAGGWFEDQHGQKYVAQGLKTAFLPDIHAVHLAITAPFLHKERPHVIAETLERHGVDLGSVMSASAYDLRGTAR